MLNGLKGVWRAGAIIGLLMMFSLFSGCSSIKLGYNNAPSLITWWLDGYLDLDSAQSTRMRTDLQSLLEWHRKEELPQLVAMLQEMQKSAASDLSAEEACRLSDSVEARAMSAVQRALPMAAGIALSLTPAQLDHLQAAYDKRNVEWREDWLEGAPAARAQTRLKKLVERTESFYGRVSEEQTALLKQQIADSAFDPAIQYREVQRRQQDTLQVLRNLRKSGATESQAIAALQALVARTRASPDPQFAAYSERVRLGGCNSIARFHASTSAAQRARLQKTLKDYENDARAVMRP